MNEELSSLIDELVAKGASEEEIDIIVQDYLSKNQVTQQPIAATPQEPKSLGFFGSIKEAFSSMFDASQQEVDPNAPAPVDPFVNAVKRGVAAGQQANILNPKTTVTPEGIEQLSELQKEQQLPTSEAFQKFNSSKTFGEAAQALADDPITVILELTAQSLASQATHGAPIIAERAMQGGIMGGTVGSVVPGIGTVGGFTGGIGSGFVSGMAETSYDLEYAGKFIEILLESGLDVQNPQALKAAFENDELMEKAAEKANLKAVPIWLFDLVSGGLAGRLTATPAKSIAGKFAQGVGEFAVQGALGGSGELAGQLVAGEEINPAAIIGEMVGELGTTPVEVAVGVSSINKKMQQSRQIINEIGDTGDAQLNAEIDESANIPEPQKQELVKEQITQQIEEKQSEQEQEFKQVESEVISNLDKEPEQIIEEQKAEQEKNSPEYQEAVRRIAELTEDLKNTERTTEESREIFGRLEEAKAALRKIAPVNSANSAKKKTPIQKQIEDTTGVTKPEKSIKMTPNEAIKFRVQEFYKGMQEGIYKGKDLSNELVTKVQEAIKESPLNPKQVSTILTKVKKTNLFTPGSISKLNDFIDKVSTDAVYADKVSTATELNDFVKGRVKNSPPQEKLAFKLYSSLDPQEVNIDDHIRVGQVIKESSKPVDKRIPLRLAEVQDYLNTATEEIYRKEFGKPSSKMTAEQKYNAVQEKRFRDKEQADLDAMSEELGLTFEERQMLLESDMSVEEGITDENKKAKIKEKYVNIARTIKPQLDNVKSDHPNLADIKEVNPKDLEVKDLKKYIETVDRIVYNGDFGDSSDVAAMGAAQRGIRELLASGISERIHDLSDIETDVTASLSQILKKVTGFSDGGAKLQLYSGMKGLSDGHAYSVEAGERITNLLNNLHERFTKLYGSKKNGFTTESIYRQGIYTTLIKYDAAVDPNEFLNETAKKAVETSIQSYRDAPDSKTANVIEALYNPFKGLKTIKEVQAKMEQIDPAGKKVVDAIIDFYTDFKELVRQYNESSQSDFSQDIINYAGETNVFQVGTKGGDYSVEYKAGTLKPKRIDSSKRFTGKVPKGSTVDFNLHAKVTRHVQKLTFQLQADKYIRQVDYFAKQKEQVLKIFGKKEGDEKSAKIAENIYTKLFDNKTGFYKFFLDNSEGIGTPKTKGEQDIAKIMTSLHKVAYSASLSGITQAPKQYTVLFSTAVNLGKDAYMVATSITEIAKNKDSFKELIKGDSVSTRGKESSVVNLGDMWDAADVLRTENTIKKILGRNFPDYVNKRFNSAWGGLKVLVRTDASAAQISWLSYYKKHLKDNGIEYTNLEEENKLRNTKERQESRAYAKQRVDETQVASNPAELARGVQTKTIPGQVLKANLIPFGGFNLSKKQRIATDLKLMRSGTPEQRAEAFQDFAGALAETAAFIGVKRGIQATWGTGLVLLAREAANLDDPEDEEEKEIRRKKQWVQNVTDGVVDMLPFLLLAPEPAKKALIDGVEGLIYWWHKTERPDLTKSEFEKETGIVMRDRPQYTTEKILDFAGNYGIMIENGIQGYELLLDQPAELSDEQEVLGDIGGLLHFGSMFGLVPADIRNPIVSEYAKQVKQAKEDNKGQKSSNKPKIIIR
jgi:hypothetical protein